MRGTIVMLAGAAALLAACGEKGNDPVDSSTGPQTTAQVKSATADIKVKPGQWRGSFTLENIEMEGVPGGAPPQMEEQMKRAMTRTDINYCVTKEEAENPDGRIFSGQQAKDCTYSGFEARGGAIKGQVACKANGGSTTAVMTGTYTPDRYDMRMDMQSAGGAQGASMTMKVRTSGQWIGPDCA